MNRQLFLRLFLIVGIILVAGFIFLVSTNFAWFAIFEFLKTVVLLVLFAIFLGWYITGKRRVKKLPKSMF